MCNLFKLVFRTGSFILFMTLFSRSSQAGLWPLVVQFLLWEAARNDPSDWGGTAEVSVIMDLVNRSNKHLYTGLSCLNKDLFHMCFVSQVVTMVFFYVRAGVSGAVTNGQIICIAKEMVMQRQPSESSDAGSPTSWSAAHACTSGRKGPSTNARWRRMSHLQHFFSSSF